MTWGRVRTQRAPYELLLIGTPDELQTVTHPSVVEVPEGWNGYRYWMLLTPYGNNNSATENPCVYVSQDGVSFGPPPGLTNPLATLADAQAAGWSHWSDTHLLFMDDGVTLGAYWRGSTGTGEGFYLSTSTDGVTWSPKVKVLEDLSTVLGSELLSPAIVREADSSFSMWTVRQITSSDRRVDHRTSADGITWSAATECTIPAALVPWHIEVQRIGSTYHALVSGGTSANIGDNLYYLTSSDQTTWEGSTSVAVPKTPDPTLDARHYRSCFVPIEGTSPQEWRVWVSGIPNDEASYPWRLIVRDRFVF